MEKAPNLFPTASCSVPETRNRNPEVLRPRNPVPETQDLRSLSDCVISRWRNAHIGFIFQSFNLLPVLSALENVELPLNLTKLSKSERIAHATKALQLVGLGDRLSHTPRQLSGGQGAARGDCTRRGNGS